MKNILNYIRENISIVLVISIVIIGSFVRTQFYGDSNLSIAGNDTQSFVDSSRAPLFSIEILTGRRLLTTNLFYKAFEPNEGYKILVNGSIETTRRVFQLGFNNLVVAQMMVSIIGWGLLAIVVSQQIKNSLMKVLSSLIIILFAFTPQIADWDSILMSESLNFSLFALQLAFLIHLVFLLYKTPNKKHILWTISWAVTYFCWSFVRPTNLLVAFVSFVLIASMLFAVKYRKNWNLWAGLIFVASVFMLSVLTTGKSTRSLNYDVYYDDLLPSPTRVAILQSWGMPAPESPEFQGWFQEHSTKTLLRFMVSYPGYPITKLIKDFPEAFKEIKQTYFKAPELNPSREILTQIGDVIHLESNTSFFMGLLLLFGISYLAYINVGESRAWAWIGYWLFLAAGIYLCASILGDTWGLNRHALLSTTIYRLCFWLFAIIIIDIALEKNSQPIQITS